MEDALEDVLEDVLIKKEERKMFLISLGRCPHQKGGEEDVLNKPLRD